ncbi:uncharacterized protein LOC113381337 [Ctenocephalides felis]|uniref:uncharacterized protein LOC113381337 n=1 Tax=Ctenocephalides felis TaxID=7515 RepID=UPI000E6E14C2|nr:uncharacterized protein LOC113381337 [Ctenocephalides felis]
MPIRKKIENLRQIAFDHTFSLINQTCQNICKKYESYDDATCAKEVLELNQFLFANLCSIFLDDMLQKRDKCLNIKDPRILIATLTNPLTRCFKMETPRDAYIPKQFWISLIHSLNNLVSLDMALICNDKLLSVVGNSCPKLEYINATSSYKRIQSDFNALLLSRNVSDKGLHCLLSCQQLRKIVIDEPRGKFTHGITYKGIEELITKLKFLEEINFTDIAAIINKPYLKGVTLKLKNITQFKISVQKIKIFEKTCPNLKCLILTNFSADENESYAALDYMAESVIHLESIKLSYFGYNSAVQKYFQMKGSFLTSIIFIGDAERSIAAEDIHHIGKYCPNLMRLHIEKIAFFDNGLTESVYDKNMFKFIKTLHLSGLRWDVEHILPLCLSNTIYIEKISLIINDENYNDHNPYRVENVLAKIFNKNTAALKSLESLYLYNPIAVTVEFITFLLAKCDNLQALNVWCEDHEKCSTLQKTLISDNFDINFQYDLE